MPASNENPGNLKKKMLSSILTVFLYNTNYWAFNHKAFVFISLFRGEAEFQYCKTAKQLDLTRSEIFTLTQQFEEDLKRIEVT